MLTGPKADFYWTPGGKLDGNETYAEALVRELDEELHIIATNIRSYHRFSSPQEILNGYTAPESEDEYFLIETDDEIKPDREISTAIWATQQDLAHMPLLDKFRNNIVAKLSQDDLI